MLKDYIILIVIIGALFGATLGNYPLAAPDAARYGEIPREMVVTGDYITPRINGVKYFEKPPLFYWMQTITIKHLGVNELAVNLINAIMGLLTCLLVYWVGRKLFGATSGFIASIVLATSTLFFAMARLVTLDMTLTFFLTAAISSFLIATREPIGPKRDLYLWLMYVFAAGAVMTKGLVGIIFPVAIIFLHTLLFNEWRNLKTYKVFTGLLILLIICLPWHILVQIRNPEFFHFYFIEQHFLRYFTPYAGREQVWWFLPAAFIGGFLPWIAFLPQAISKNFPRNFSSLAQYKTTIFLVLWSAFVFVFYFFSSSKLIPYLLPMLPPLAILVGYYLANELTQPKHLSRNLSFYFIILINLILGIGAIGAAFILNFSEHLFTRNNLLLAATAAIVAAIAIFFTYRQSSCKNALIVLTITFGAVLLCIAPIIPVANNQSIKTLALAIKTKAQPDTEIFSYNTYYQDLPLYLQRRVTVVNYKGELEFGTKHQDTSEWMIDEKTFWQRMQAKKKFFLVANKDYVEHLNKTAPNLFTTFASGIKDVVLTNKNS